MSGYYSCKFCFKTILSLIIIMLYKSEDICFVYLLECLSKYNLCISKYDCLFVVVVIVLAVCCADTDAVLHPVASNYVPQNRPTTECSIRMYNNKCV